MSPVKLPVVVLALFLSLFTTSFCLAEDEVQEVTAVGLGGGEQTKARDDAINDALRKAIEQAVGTYISSETTVEQMMLVEDRIYSESRGYIKKYELINESFNDGICQVKIKAQVKMTELANELEAIGLIIKKKQNPRVMVVVYSTEQNSTFLGIEMEGNRNTGNQLENMLMQKGFRLVDAGQTRRKKELESLLLAGDPSQAGRLAKDWGAEILIEADVRRAFVDQRSVMGRSMRFFSNEIRIKALEADTAKILYSGFQTLPPSGANALAPLEEMTTKLAREMIASILGEWSKDVYQAGVFELNLNDVSFSQVNSITSALKELRGVVQVTSRSFQARHAGLEIKFQGNINDLALKISEIRVPRLEVVGLAANTLDVAVAK